MTPAGAERRVRTTVAVLLGVAALVFTALDLGALLPQLSAAPPAWTASALVAGPGTCVALALAAPLAPVRVVRIAAGAAALGGVAVLATLPLAMDPAGTAGTAPWPLQLTALGTTAAALTWGPAAVWAVTVATGALVALDRAIVTTEDLGLIAVQDAGYATFFDAVFVALALGALHVARRVDATEAATTAAAVAAAERGARLDERARVDALLHDRVLATLLAAGRGTGGTATAAQAAAALDGLRGLEAGDRPLEPADAQRFAARLQGLAGSIAPWAHVSTELLPSTPPVPGAVAEALLGAAGEALRNAVQHAPGADVHVHLHADARDVEIAVVDDGEGFHPDRTGPGRLGVRTSIVGRMRAAGGDAEVRSRPGHGTAVRIRWPR